MNKTQRERTLRVTLVVMIMLLGLTLIPFINMPAEALGWELFTGAYTPNLDVNQNTGKPGSIFTFTGSGYPPHSKAMVYVNGDSRGMVTIDGSGVASFLLNTLGSPARVYNVTLEVDINASATESIELLDTGNMVLPPPDFNGSTLFLKNIIFMPLISDK